ncbi:MAG: dihydropyrimidinase [Candidatus Odinarchaeota archaeon]
MIEYDLVIKNGLIINAFSSFKANIGINDDEITSISKLQLLGTKSIDADGLLVFPGIIDPHVHFELPMKDAVSADDFISGTRAAVFGGVTTVLDFSTQSKGENLLDAIAKRKQLIKEGIFCNVGMHCGITDGETSDGDIKKAIEMGYSSFKMFTAYRDRGMMLDDGELLKILESIKNHGGLPAFHAENSPIIEQLTKKFLTEGKTDPIYHALSRPDYAEEEAILRCCFLAQLVHSDILFVHIGSKKGMQAIERSRSQYGISIYSETCPHYLFLTDDLFMGETGHLYLLSPPLRKKTDQEYLWHALAAGKIDIIGTDHCLFTKEQKGNGTLPFDKVPNGLMGVETSLPLVYHGIVNQRNLPVQLIPKIMSYNPAKIYRIKKRGIIAPGQVADITLLDPRREMTIGSENLHMPSNWNAYEGMEVKGWPVTTIINGMIVVEDLELCTSKGPGKQINRVL